MAGYCPSSCLWVFVDWDKVKVHKQAKKKEKKNGKERGYFMYPPIFDQTSLVKTGWGKIFQAGRSA